MTTLEKDIGQLLLQQVHDAYQAKQAGRLSETMRGARLGVSGGRATQVKQASQGPDM